MKSHASVNAHKDGLLMWLILMIISVVVLTGMVYKESLMTPEEHQARNVRIDTKLLSSLEVGDFIVLTNELICVTVSNTNGTVTFRNAKGTFSEPYRNMVGKFDFVAQRQDYDHWRSRSGQFVLQLIESERAKPSL